MLDSAVLDRILIEVTLGKPPAKTDTAEEATMRRKLTAEVAEIKRKGGVVEIPGEVPDVTVPYPGRR